MNLIVFFILYLYILGSVGRQATNFIEKGQSDFLFCVTSIYYVQADLVIIMLKYCDLTINRENGLEMYTKFKL